MQQAGRDALGFGLDRGRAGPRHELLLGVEDLAHAQAQCAPVLLGDGELTAEIEQGALADLGTVALGAHEAEGEVVLAVAGAGASAADEHRTKGARGGREVNPTLIFYGTTFRLASWLANEIKDIRGGSAPSRSNSVAIYPNLDEDGLGRYLTPGRPERIARYYAMVEWLDETVGELLEFLDKKSLSNTVVLYVADNGWITTEDRADQPAARAKMSPYEMGVRTPIMIRWPGKIEPGRDDRTLVSSIDLVPTILQAAGIERPANLPGISLLDTEALHRRKQVFGSTFAHTAVNVLDPVANLKYRTVVREDGWKLVLPYALNRGVTHMIRGQIADWMRFEAELYNVLEDPHETNDLASEHAELVEELRAALQDWWLVPEELPDTGSE